MKKKLIGILCLVLCIMFTSFLVACGNNNDGTYYLYQNGNYDKSSFVEIKGDTWKDDDGETGSLKIDGDSITLYVEFMGEQEEFCSGTISDGVLTLNIMGAKITYCKEGKAPSNNSSSGGGENGGSDNVAKYTITYDANGGTFAGDKTTFTQSNQSSNSLLTAPTSPTRENYTFKGWAKDKNGKTMWQFASDKPTENTTLYAIWAEKSAILYSVDGAKIDGTEIFMLVDNTTTSVMLSSKVVCSQDSVWKLYYDSMGITEIATKIAVGKTGSLSNGDNIFYIVVSSLNGVEVNVYELNVYRSYSVPVYFYNGSSEINSGTAYTGYEYSASYTPTITGYTFNYWKTSNGVKYEKKVIWGALSLYADKTAKKYTVSLNVNGGNALDTTTKEVTYDSSYSLPKPTRTGYSFAGWYYGDTQLTNANGSSIAVWNYASDKTLKAKWTANAYNVTLNRSNTSAGTVTGAGEHNYDSNVTITATTNNGYTWLGWYDNEDTLVTRNTSYSFTMGLGSTYTAKWELKTEMQNFNFTSTTTTCTITGIKDKTVTEIIVPDYVTNINGGAFSGCGKLQSITLPFVGGSKTATTASASTLFGYIFGTSNYDGSTATEQYYSSSSYVTYYIPTTLTSLTIAENVKNICRYAFYNCKALTEIKFNAIAMEDLKENNNVFSYAGQSGEGIKVTIGKNVTKIPAYLFYSSPAAFSYMPKISSVEFEEGSVCTSISNDAFHCCISLTSVTIGANVTSIGSDAFSGCYKLVEVINKSSLNITVGSKDNGYIGYYAKQVITEESQSKIITSGDYKFYNDNGTYYLIEYIGTATDITLPENINGNSYSIYQRAFYNNYKITSVVIPNGVTSIGSYAFRDCYSLTSVTFEDTSTWYYTSTENHNYTGGTEIDVTVPSTNATYLTSTYVGKTWYKQ